MKLRLIYLGIGLALGLLVAGVVGFSYNEIIEIKETEYKARIAHMEQVSQQSISISQKLQEENKQLRTKTVEKINADGSKELITETSSDSSSKDQSLQYDVAMLEHTVVTLREEHKRELLYMEKTRPAFTLLLGVDMHANKSLHFSYGGLAPFAFGGWATEKGEIGLGVGMQF